MKFEVKETVTKEVKYLSVACGVRYWEDATVNGVEDEDGSLIPFRQGGDWAPLIDVDEGKVVDWPEGTTASIHYKVCDDGAYSLLDKDKNAIKTIEGYVPNCMCPEEAGYGDYVIMEIDGSGKISGFEPSFGEFEND